MGDCEPLIGRSLLSRVRWDLELGVADVYVFLSRGGGVGRFCLDRSGRVSSMGFAEWVRGERCGGVVAVVRRGGGWWLRDAERAFRRGRLAGAFVDCVG